MSYKAQKAVAATLTARERKTHPRHPDFKHRTNGDMAVWLDNRQGDANVMRDIHIADTNNEIALAPEQGM